MTSGKLGMIACPILEDELIHNLLSDKEEKNVFLLMNDNCSLIIEKLNKNNIKYTILGEQSYLNGNENIPDSGYNIIIWMQDLGLHQEPDDLKTAIRENIQRMDGMVDGIMLYYGLCGQALAGIEEWGKKNLKTPITIFKDKDGRLCDDCVCVPLGGTDEYLKLLKKHTGVMYLTPAMACSQDEFMSKMEMFKGIESYNGMSREEYMKFLLDLAGYTQTLKIQTGLGDQEHFQSACEEYAKKYGLELITLEDGWVSTEVCDRIYAEAKAFLN